MMIQSITQWNNNKLNTGSYHDANFVVKGGTGEVVIMTTSKVLANILT